MGGVQHGRAWYSQAAERKKVVTDSQRQRQGKKKKRERKKRWLVGGWRGGLAERVSLGLLVPSVITSISHSLSFQSSLRSELMWAEICLSLWPSNRLRISTRTKAGSCVLNPIHHPQSSAFNSSKLKVGGGEICWVFLFYLSARITCSSFKNFTRVCLLEKKPVARLYSAASCRGRTHPSRWNEKSNC